MDGQAILKNGTTIEGKLAVESLGTYEILRYQKDVGQDTYPVDDIEQLILIQQNGRVSRFRRYSFHHPELNIKDDLLLEVLYESASIKLFKKDLRSIERFFKIIPLPGFIILFTWGKKLEESQIILMSDADIQNLTIINNPTSNPKSSLRVNKKQMIELFMSNHSGDIRRFIRNNRLNCNKELDLIKVVGHYDSLNH